MNRPNYPDLGFIGRSLVIGALLLFVNVLGYTQKPQQEPTPEDVLRINTDLVQTDVTVLDRSGRLVEGLRPEQFQLTLDGRAQPITFFEFVRTGTAREAARIAASHGAADSPKAAEPVSPDRRRIIFFFLDDFHLSESSVVRARKALFQFVETQMTVNDQIAIVSTSGQIGFLQQLTDYKPMLNAAIGRLAYKRVTEGYAGKVPISEYQAVAVADNQDRDLFVYLLFATINEYQSKGPLRGVAANLLQNQVRQLSTQSKTAAMDTFDVLGSLLHSSSPLPGRKLVFFISDGFMTDVRSSNARPLLKAVTDLAAREGAVVYAMDARGTVTDSTVDAGRNDFPDGMATGTQARQPSLENSALQEPLHVLADDTGGRAIIGSNSFADAFRQAIDETSAYYLLGWRAADEDQRNGRARVKVTVKDHPELRVRLRSNYWSPPEPAAKDEVVEKEPEPAETGLLKALGALYPQRTIPTALSVGYVNVADQGLLLKASMQVDRDALSFHDGRDQTALDVIGAAVDDRGIIVTFKQVVNVAADAQQDRQGPIVWNQQLRLQPGLYQIRVAVRERDTGRTGSAQQWIEVPDVSNGKLQLSSLFLGERRAAPADEKFATGVRPVTVDVDHKFASASVLRFQTYVYNAARAAGAPDVEIQARVLRTDKTVITTVAARVPADTTKDLSRLPYWAEIELSRLTPGRYTLEVVATDRIAKTSVTQTTSLLIE